MVTRRRRRYTSCMTDASLVPPRLTLPGRNLFFRRSMVAAVLAALVFAWSGFTGTHVARATGQATALVLDPFPSQHSPGFSSQDAVTILSTAGFDGTYLEGSAGTVDAMRTIS